MKTVLQVASLIVVTLLFGLTSFVAFAGQDGADGASTPVVANDEAGGPFVANGPAVNTAGQSGVSPDLVIKPGTQEAWVALAQSDQIVVSRFNTVTQQWQPQGGVVNTAIARRPALSFGGAAHNTPWVAWSESMSTLSQVMVAYWDGKQWQAAGTVNHDLQMSATDPTLATNPGDGLPWVAWDEINGQEQHQIVTSRAVSGASGISWQTVGNPLNFDAQRNGALPNLVFTSGVSATAWLAWSETTGPKTERVFVARAVADSAAAGGFRWQPVGKQTTCLTNGPEDLCALNSALSNDAGGIRIAVGALARETTSTPWVVFSEVAATGKPEIRVLRLDQAQTPGDSTDDRFIAVGGALNTQCLGPDHVTGQGGTQPDIYFVGNVPHVAWVEMQEDLEKLFVCHLGDAHSGQERWDLDTVFPVNRGFGSGAATPSLGSDGNTPYLAWQERLTTTNVFVAYRYPTAPAWGRSYPSLIRNISRLPDFVDSAATDGIQPAIQAIFTTTNLVTFTTSGNHAQGWEHIAEIQFKLANAQMTAFVGKYVVSEDKIYVENPARPGEFLGGVKPGSATPLETSYVILDIAKLRIRTHSLESAALDIDWPLRFKETTLFQDFIQSINMVYDNNQQTGFFRVGMASLDYRLHLLRIVNRQ